MKKQILLCAFLAAPAIAAAPGTSCPSSNYVAISSDSIIIATTCPQNYATIGTAESCLVSSPSGNCIMYAPVGVSYTDSSGTYEYTEPCVM